MRSCPQQGRRGASHAQPTRYLKSCATANLYICVAKYTLTAGIGFSRVLNLDPSTELRSVKSGVERLDSEVCWCMGKCRRIEQGRTRSQKKPSYNYLQTKFTFVNCNIDRDDMTKSKSIAGFDYCNIPLTRSPLPRKPNAR